MQSTVPFRFLQAILLFSVLLTLTHAQNSQGPTREPVPHDKLTTPLDRVAPYRRVLWVTRWDYRTPEDVAAICYNAASARFSDILFQVRGEGTVFYPSQIEPWAWELTGKTPETTGRDPGWDPLAVALREGHRWGLRVHAYLNVLPGWAQKTIAPPASGQLYSVRRSWFMVDAAGRRMSPRDWYAFLDPAREDVRAHLVSLFSEVARKYAVDGIHLDYIRYPHEKGDFSYQDDIVDRFVARYGAKPSSRPEQWQDFRRRQITETVAAISRAVKSVRPGLELSAAVLADRPKGENEAMQDALDWVRRGLVDAIAPMAYTDQMDVFERYMTYYVGDDLRRHVWLGVWADPDRNPRLAVQLERAVEKNFGGIGVFAYTNLFRNHKPTPRAVQAFNVFIGGE